MLSKVIDDDIFLNTWFKEFIHISQGMMTMKIKSDRYNGQFIFTAEVDLIEANYSHIYLYSKAGNKRGYTAVMIYIADLNDIIENLKECQNRLKTHYPSKEIRLNNVDDYEACYSIKTNSNTSAIKLQYLEGDKKSVKKQKFLIDSSEYIDEVIRVLNLCETYIRTAGDD